MQAPSRRRGRRAVIIGGSMSGLFTAAFLRKIGWDVDVFERSPVELVGRGAGITTHPELLEALERSGAGTRDLGVEVERRITIDRQGRVIGERRLPQILTSWDRLQRLLRETIDPAHYHLGHTFERVEQDGSSVRVQFAEGRIEHADLLVGGDGIRSGVRAQVAPQIQPIYSGYYIWRGAPNEADLAAETRRSIFPYFVFFLPEQQQVIGYPISGFDNDLRPGRRRYNFIWYRVGDAQTLRRMCVDDAGRQHEHSVPPPLIRKDLVAQMRVEAEETMPAAFVDCLRNIAQPFFTPIYDFSSPRLVFGRVALVGDAASSSRPHMGFGVAKAGGDAQALADALEAHHDIDQGLAAYNALRQPIGERIMLHGRKLGTHLGVDLRTDEDRRMWKLLQQHEAMMDWIAVPDFLAAYR
jgi:2-polyprenyl-6-methoxyphenol hydroxylase-like FAD-dependent oxidoreductase